MFERYRKTGLVVATLLGGLALSESIPKSSKATEAARPGEPNAEVENFRTFVKGLLYSEPTPQEEADACIEILDEVEEIDPMQDPILYLREFDTYKECQKEASIDAKRILHESSTKANLVRAHLLRCTPEGEEFLLEDLEDCEAAEEKWIFALSEGLEKRGIFVNPEYQEGFEYSEVADSWIKPGFGFELDSPDGTFHGTYQFTIHNEDEESVAFLLEETDEYYENPGPHFDTLVHSKTPLKLGELFAAKYKEVLSRDSQMEDVKE